MYLVVIAWIYVVLLMSVAEATNTNGTVLGAVVTFLLYGLGPCVLVVYLMRTPARNKAGKKRRAEELARHQAQTAAPEPSQSQVDPALPGLLPPDGGSHAARGAEAVAPITGSPGITPMRKEP